MSAKRFFLNSQYKSHPSAKLPELVLYYLICRNRLLTHHKAIYKPAHTAYKNYQLKNRLIHIQLRGNALCLLKTQFAKKPKNPV